MSRIKLFFFSKLGLVTTSILLTFFLFAGGVEIYKRIEYNSWRADFLSQTDWFKKTTIQSPNEKLIWEYRPYGSAPQVGMNFNRYGYRDRDYETPKKPAGVYRIAFAGDSVTMGLLIKNTEDIFVRKFEKLVTKAQGSRKIQVLNFAVDGYNTIQVSEMIRQKVLPFEPDKIVYTMCLNDFDFITSAGNKMRLFRPPTSFFLFELHKIRRGLGGDDFHRFYFNQNRDDVFEDITHINSELTKKGVKYEVVILPVFPVAPFHSNHFDGYPFHDIHKTLHDFLEKNKIPYVDMLPFFFRYKNIPLNQLAFDVWHPTVFGHRIIAEALAKKLSLD